MKIGIIGGGSLHVVAQTREVLKLREIVPDAEIVLQDIDADRVAAVAQLLRWTPEIAGTGVTVRTTAEPDEAIEGADFVQVIARPWSGEMQARSDRICLDHGVIGSDNLSVGGALLALRSGPFVLDVARRTERLAPDATLLIFTNPVPILVNLVRRGTDLRTIGICEGQANHCWDLSRMMNWPEYCWDFDVEAAGINHFSWILKMRLSGRDFFPEFDRKIRREGIDFDALRTDPLYEHLLVVLPQMEHAYKEFGTLLFSSEPDGLPHLCFYRETVERKRAARKGFSAEAERARRRQDRQEVLALAREEPEPEFWSDPEAPRWRGYPHRKVATNALVIQGLRGHEPVHVTATRLNEGAVEGFPDDVAMEYTLRLAEGRMEKADTYRLPRVAVGVTRMLAEHQSYVADAILEESPRLFRHGVYAYPLCRDRRATEALLADLLEANGEELPPFML